eukprot:CAMPEP_0182424104 /NCGR_PEP_ID=MMETSP1167-20130531/10255_1 /TAXON_ID=2988 /ORGANISM="Mallomonas Sp, Strain CCMP3275" /LENGTH=343 /DNA_ID=CAMNT_0024603653 /DNA_START=150 /DNA_END=1181 /DNA_ORIENTATION=+
MTSSPLSVDEIFNFRIRWFVLVVLCLQNSGHALLTRYSQGILHESYSSTEVVLVSELIKILFSAYMAIKENEESDAVGSNGFYKLLWLAAHSSKVIVLVILYSVGNILAYYALARVDAAAYTVCLQLKAFTTAAFAVLFLGRNISVTKWRALVLLVIGCVLVASPTFNRPCEEQLAPKIDNKSNISNVEAGLGIGAVLIMVTISGFSAVYFEGMLKKTHENITIWERNFQLALYSVIFLICLMVSENMINADEAQLFTPLFKGWTIHTVLIATTQAAGGILVAATLKYADAVLKCLATAGSIVLSAVLGKILLGGVLDIFVSLGSVATILAIFNYTLDSTSSQ